MMYGIAGVRRCRREALELRARAQDRRGRAEHRGCAPASRSLGCLLLLEQQRQARKTLHAFMHFLISCLDVPSDSCLLAFFFIFK